jgi:muramoyltetrapeptide carboxypeptidase LdcA involved in peptidoglycan recycling
MHSIKVQIITPSYKASSTKSLNDIKQTLSSDFRNVEYSSYVVNSQNENEWRKFYSGSPPERASDLKDALFNDEDCTILWAYRGGRNCAEVLEHVPKDQDHKIKKVAYLIGFSDITALHYFCNKYYPRIKTIHALIARGKKLFSSKPSFLF